MNIQALNTSINPFKFFIKNSEYSPKVRSAESHQTEHDKADKSQRHRHGDPQKLLENRLLKYIQAATNRAAATSTPKSTDHALGPGQLADKILAEIAKSYGQHLKADPGFDTANYFNQVKQGIDQGFADAREALDELGLLNDAQKNNLDEAYKTIQAGLSNLQSAQTPSPTNEISVRGFAAQMSQSAELEIVTKEGDVVTIKMAQSGSINQGSSQIKQNGLEASAFVSSIESSSDFQISVEGDLNEDEQKSLKALLKQINQVGKEFFSDGIQTAFKQAQKIGLDTEQLASLSMNLSMQKSVQAISVYQQTAAPEQNLAADKVNQIGDFFNRARTDLQPLQAALKPFADPVSAFNSLFEAVNKMLIAQNPAQETDHTQPTLPEFAKALGVKV